jgi:glycosyltransferase involved in cell wall biosynthesis
LIDCLSARAGGGVTDAAQLLPQLAAEAEETELSVMLSSRYQRDLISLVPASVRLIDADIPPGLAARMSYLTRRVPEVVRDRAVDVLLTMGEISAYRAPCRRIAYFRNPNLIASPRLFEGVEPKVRHLVYRSVRRPLVRATIKRSHRILFLSKTFAREVQDALGIDPSKSAVVYLGVNPGFTPGTADRDVLSRLDVPDHYLLAVSTFTRHKNYPRLLRAFASLLEGGAPPDLNLLIAGGPGPADVMRDVHRELDTPILRGRVRLLGAVAYDDMPHLYRGARAFVLPTKLETFCHPLVEAMATGVPVLTSDLPITKEICGEAALYVAPLDTAGLTTGMATVIGDNSVRATLIGRGVERARDFSWARTARGVLREMEGVTAVGS